MPARIAPACGIGAAGDCAKALKAASGSGC